MRRYERAHVNNFDSFIDEENSNGLSLLSVYLFGSSPASVRKEVFYTAVFSGVHTTVKTLAVEIVKGIRYGIFVLI